MTVEIGLGLMRHEDVDTSAFWLYPDWEGEGPFWMRPPKLQRSPSPSKANHDWRFNGKLVAYEARHGQRGLATYRSILERIYSGHTT